MELEPSIYSGLETLPKLRDDGSNWIIYKDRVLTHLTANGLRRYVLGTARKPAELVEKNGLFYKSSTSEMALTDDEYEAHLEKEDLYAQKEAQVRIVICATTTRFRFYELGMYKLQSASELWAALTSVHELEGNMVQMDSY